MKQKLVGIIILSIIIAAGLVIYVASSGTKKTIVVKGYVGGEKAGLLESEDFKKILKDKFGVIIDYTKVGSIEMARETKTTNIDFLWPSNMIALEIFKESNKKLVKSENIFNSPIVLYSWDTVVGSEEPGKETGLIKAGIVQKINGTYYIVDMPRLIQTIMEGKKWSDLNINELYGKVNVMCTDPVKSNSGNIFAGLLANLLNNEDVVDESLIDKHMPNILSFFKRLGYMESSSGDLFEQYLRTGVGAKPLIVGYENQMVEFATKYKDYWPNVKEKVRILYPVPTIWSSHPLIALTPAGTELIKILSDEEIQQFAWEKHGFRTGLIGVQNNPKVLEVVGIPEKIEKVMQMPSAKVMDKIIKALEGK
ncbi:MAG: hypothetical protein L3V56_06350 [Candidatus Magnetoovum sp. WYHC-5]|nr:hypothetical protein [Candidatus Magnetoovum sp. WYHC-5]